MNCAYFVIKSLGKRVGFRLFLFCFVCVLIVIICSQILKSMVRAPTVKLPLTLAGGGGWGGEGVETESRPYDLNISKQSVVANSWGDKKKNDDSRQQYPQPEIIIFTKAGGNSCLFIRGLYLPAVTAVTLNKTSNASTAAWPGNAAMAGINPSLLPWGGFCGQGCFSGALTKLFFPLGPELGRFK